MLETEEEYREARRVARIYEKKIREIRRAFSF